MSWAVSESLLHWRVEWVDGPRYVRFSPNQYGRVVSVSSHGLDCCWAEIHKAAELARNEMTAAGIRRHGWRLSAERRRLCELVAAKLNAAGVVPPIVEPGR